MFDEFLDLPLHPLMVHLPVVLIPLLIILAVVYALIPSVRRVTGWAVVALAVVTPVVTWVTRESGYELKARLAGQNALPEELAADVNEHARLSYVLIWLVAALAAVSLVLVVATRRRARSANDTAHPATGIDRHDVGTDAGVQAGGSAARVMQVSAAIVVVGLSAASGYYLFETGDLGARMVWEGR